MTFNNIAIIPARGGSKRLPRKNILPLDGKPLLQIVIENLHRTNVFDQIIVSTEDEEIANIAKENYAYIVNRPIALAQDKSSVVDVCIDILGQVTCDTFCCIYATAALLKPDTIQATYKEFKHDLECQVLMGVSHYNYSPIQALKIDSNGFAKPLLPEYEKLQSQLYPQTRVSNGTFYWARKKSFLEEKTFYAEKLKTHDVPNNQVCDVDTIDDYIRLQTLYNQQSTI